MNRDGRSTRAARVAWLIAVVISLLGLEPAKAGETLAERRARIENMDAAEKAELRRAQERFAGLDPAEQARLRDLHQKIESHPRSDELWSAIERYCEWVQTLSQNDRADLRDLPPAERIERMKEICEQRNKGKARRADMRAKWIERQFPAGAGEEEIEAFLRWIDGYVARKGLKLMEALPRPHRQRVEEELAKAKDDPARRLNIFGWMWVRQQWRERGKLPQLDENDLKELGSQLPETARAWFLEMDPGEQRKLVARLIGVQIMSRYAFGLSGGPPPVVGDPELAKYLEKEISPELRDRLLARPGEEQRRQLWWHYMRSKWSGDIPGWPQGLPGPPGRMRGPGRSHPAQGGPNSPSRFGPRKGGPPMPGRPRRQSPGHPSRRPAPPENAPENSGQPSKSQ